MKFTDEQRRDATKVINRLEGWGKGSISVDLQCRLTAAEAELAEALDMLREGATTANWPAWTEMAHTFLSRHPTSTGEK